MGKQITYEWIVEQADENGDIEDLNWWDTAAEALLEMSQPAPEGLHYQWALRRDRHDPVDDDLKDRQYAYVEGGVLPAEFEDGAAIPLRYRAELSHALLSLSVAIGGAA